MATVYLARDLRHDREVALKVLHPELAGGFATDRFEREIRTAARLQHPHLLPVFDSGEAAEVATDRHVWTDRYETQLADVFQVQATIAEQVAAALDVTLRVPERAALASEPTSNFEAYTTYLQGEAVTGTDHAALRKRLELFERAATLDTGFAAAHAQVAFAR